ncbi:MAG: hypothetical protein ACRES9_06900 [Gammaproteobacteria bacterium]
MKKIAAIALIVVAAALAAASVCPAYAGFGLGSLTGHKSSNAQILNQQSKLVHDFSTAQTQTLKAQALLAQAFGDKNQAAELRADAKTLANGASAQDVEKSIGDSSRANKQINKNMKAGVKLTEQGKKLYAQAVPYYVTGLTQTIALRPDIMNFSSSAQQALESASIVDKLSLRNKLAAGVYLTKHAPAYISELQGTTGEILSYSKKENITIPADTLSRIPKY